jgi:hypothetical protein
MATEFSRADTTIATRQLASNACLAVEAPGSRPASYELSAGATSLGRFAVGAGEPFQVGLSDRLG